MTACAEPRGPPCRAAAVVRTARGGLSLRRRPAARRRRRRTAARRARRRRGAGRHRRLPIAPADVLRTLDRPRQRGPGVRRPSAAAAAGRGGTAGRRRPRHGGRRLPDRLAQPARQPRRHRLRPGLGGRRAGRDRAAATARRTRSPRAPSPAACSPGSPSTLLAWKRGVHGYRLVLVGIGASAVLAAVNSYLLVKADFVDARPGRRLDHRLPRRPRLGPGVAAARRAARS